MKLFPALMIVFFFAFFVLEPSSEDPELEFEQLISEHFESYKNDPRERITKLGGGWAKEQRRLNGSYRCDIQKLNLLINPYTASCEFILARDYTDFHETKEAAQADNDFIKSDETEHRHFYWYQNGKWVVSERKNRGYKGWFDCNEIIKTGENKGNTNIHGCWENNFSKK